MNDSARRTSWQGLEAWVLENEALRTVVVPALGAKIVSLFDKHSQTEWLVGSGGRPLKPVAYGADFVAQDMSGWDEMFPTIAACRHPAPGEHAGGALPDHGEVWALPWTLVDSRPGTLALRVVGKALPYRLTREISLSAAARLEMRYTAENLGRERMPYIWAAHPQFACGDSAQIYLPPQVDEVCNTIPADWGWGAPETRFNWPLAVNPDGRQVHIDRVGPASLHRARKFFALPQARPGWAGLVRQPSGDWLRLEWDPDKVSYLGIWIDEGALSHTSAVALEPTTGFYDSLAVAWEKQEVTVLEPGASHTWALAVQVGSREHPFQSTEPPAEQP